MAIEMINTGLIPVVWIAAAGVFVIIEAVTTGLTSIWFAVGAAFASVISLFTSSIILQCTVFILVSIALLVLTRLLAKKRFSKDIEKTNIDALIGKKGIVALDIEPLQKGTVKADGKIWAATAEKNIETGTKVIITGINGVTVMVSPDEQEEKYV